MKPETNDERTYLAALDCLAERGAHTAAFEHLYGNLTILDGKTGSLMQFNALLLAIASFAVFAAQSAAQEVKIAMFVAFVATMVSGAILLWVVQVHWSSEVDLRNPDQHRLTLCRVRNRRTALYRISWYFSFFAVLLIFGASARHFWLNL